MEDVISFVISKYNYWCYIVLLMIGLYAMIVKNNLVKKIIGMNIFQTAIILFYVSISVKKEGTLPTIIIDPVTGAHTARAADYINPLPHVLMLTAIVVSVATLGIALALAIKIYKEYDTLEEDEIFAQIRKK